MPTTCEFEFIESPAGIYYSGQLMNGRIKLDIDNAKTVRGIYIRINGTGYCHWTTGSGKNKKSYTGEETYLDEKTYFVGGESDEITVQPGLYHYSFQCHLPAQLPTSLEGGIGYIRYTARVTLDRPMWPDQHYETTFTVIKPLNLNDSASYREPVHGEKCKTFYPCCLLCCCESEPLIIKARLPVGGYTPGQTMILDFTVNNSSDQDVEDFEAQFVKRILYSTHAGSSRTKDEEVVIAEKTEAGCRIGESKVYRMYLVVDPVPPTDFMTSNVCKVQYCVRINGNISGCHNNAIIVMPITIGTYPILDNLITHPIPGGYSHPTQTGMSSLPVGDNVIIDQPTAPLLPSGSFPTDDKSPYPAQDPPTYEEAIHSTEGYKPKYPVYRRATSYSSNEFN